MSPSPVPTPPPIIGRPLFRARWGLILAAASLGMLLAPITMGVWAFHRCRHLGPAAGALRDALLTENPTAWKKQCELTTRGLPMGSIRFIAGFVPLPSDGQQVLQGIREVEVAVYQARRDAVRPQTRRDFTAPDLRMSACGWERLAGVFDGPQHVVIYVPKNLKSEHDARFCLAVQESAQWVVIAGEADLGALAELIHQHWPPPHTSGQETHFTALRAAHPTHRWMARPLNR